VYGNVYGPACRVGSSKVTQLAALARRRCLLHDCHFKCAIMAAGLAKKNAILRNSSWGCLTGRALRRLGFTRSLTLSLSIFFSLAKRAQPVADFTLSFSLSLSLSLPLPLCVCLSFSRACFSSSSSSLSLRSVRSPADANSRWAFHWGLRATGRDLTVVYHSLFAFLRLPLVSSSFLSSTVASSLSFSSNIFTFLLASSSPDRLLRLCALA